IDQKGAEKILGDNFYTILRNSGYKEDKLRYDAFDFHKECSKMRWDRLNILIDRQNSDLKKFGHLSSFCLQIDQKGAEKILGDNFYTILRNSGYKEDKLRYDAFDFHKECSKMRWDRLNILIDRQNSDLKKFGYD
ncbi:Phosphatidylinositide phosphatase SAC1, partial [Exaiptasia diaphana]